MNGHNQIRYKIQISVCVDEFTYLLHTKAWLNLGIAETPNRISNLIDIFNNTM